MNKTKDVFNSPLLLSEKSVAQALVPENKAFFDSDDMPFEACLISEKINNVAIISIHGAITNHGTFWSWLFGYSSVDSIRAALDYFLEDSSIDTIILNCDSPGGTVDGVEGLSDYIFEARKKKKIIGCANYLAASACYWILSACSEVYLAAKTAQVGSIGVLVVHGDYSKMLEEAGIKYTQIVSTSKKNPSPSFEPLSEEGKAELQSIVDKIHGIFISQVSRNRGLSLEKIQGGLEGSVFFAEEAVSNGLADGVSEFSSLVAKHQKQKTISVDLLKNDYQSIYDSVFMAGFNLAKKETEKKAFMAGSLEERNRIKSIKKATIRGFESVAEKAIEEGLEVSAFKAKQSDIIADNGGLTIAQLESETSPIKTHSMEGHPAGSHVSSIVLGAKKLKGKV